MGNVDIQTLVEAGDASAADAVQEAEEAGDAGDAGPRPAYRRAGPAWRPGDRRRGGGDRRRDARRGAGRCRSAGRGARGGGGPAEEPGYFVPPHIFADVPRDSTIAQEEIFGPVLSVIRASNFDEALEIALGVRYGLTGGLYSRNPATSCGRLGSSAWATSTSTSHHWSDGGSAALRRVAHERSGVEGGGPDYLLQFMKPRVVTENTIRRGFAPDTLPAK